MPTSRIASPSAGTAPGSRSSLEGEHAAGPLPPVSALASGNALVVGAQASEDGSGTSEAAQSAAGSVTGARQAKRSQR